MRLRCSLRSWLTHNTLSRSKMACRRLSNSITLLLSIQGLSMRQGLIQPLRLFSKISREGCLLACNQIWEASSSLEVSIVFKERLIMLSDLRPTWQSRWRRSTASASSTKWEMLSSDGMIMSWPSPITKLRLSGWLTKPLLRSTQITLSNGWCSISTTLVLQSQITATRKRNIVSYTFWKNGSTSSKPTIK